MLDKLDEKMKNVLHVLTSKAGVDNNFILSKKYFLTHEVYKRSMHHLQAKNSRVDKQEAKLIFQHQIADLVQCYSIPPSLIMNFDQTLLEYASVANQTLSKKGSKSKYVAIKGLSVIQSFTAPFGINFAKNIYRSSLFMIKRKNSSKEYKVKRKVQQKNTSVTLTHA